MTREEIIRMAREAGFETKRDMAWVDQWEVTRSLERFAALVEQRAAAAERESCAQVCELLVKEFKETGGRPYDWKSLGAEDCAYEIRARGEKP